MTQQGSVLMVQTPDGGDICLEGGTLVRDGGLSTAVYLSMFGGNEQDDTLAENKQTWWGNIGELAEAQYRSETQYLLKSLPATSGNLRRVEDAVLRDLAWLKNSGVATSIEVEVTIPALNKLRLVVSISADKTKIVLKYTENWKMQS